MQNCNWEIGQLIIRHGICVGLKLPSTISTEIHILCIIFLIVKIYIDFINCL